MMEMSMDSAMLSARLRIDESMASATVGETFQVSTISPSERWMMMVEATIQAVMRNIWLTARNERFLEKESVFIAAYSSALSVVK
jgi:hypothetical protein